MIIDGYNVIFAWGLDTESLQDARKSLLDTLDDYAGYSNERITVVFDGYRTKKPQLEERHGLVNVVYTSFGVTADTYIQRFVKASDTPVKVVTADYLEQLTVFWSGAYRLTPAELKSLICAEREKHIRRLHRSSLDGSALKKRLDIDAVTEN